MSFYIRLDMSSEVNKIELSQYTEVDYLCHVIELEIEIQSSFAKITNVSKYEKNKNTQTKVLVLNGVNLKLENILVNNKVLDSTEYVLETEKLILKDLPDSFTLETHCIVNPYENFSGEGLYKSGDILCTQCEAEGFRKITFHQDRPDVMSVFKTKIIANSEDYPLLLSNGNLIESGVLDDGRHYALWSDPFKKPSYLFAMVAGNLFKIEDSFKTLDNREVKLEIFVDPGNEDKCAHAMESLKNSMKWDEETYGLVYDLDIYMIVAVDSFNMGAMENKGLNIFNSHYVLAKTETATDSDFQGIEAVIGHEYFHNWTGNRVTCRDWFQLTLKEGLTVYRDQEFSSDMGSRAVKRIEDIKGLKGAQFAEDAGPLSHPIQPKSYVEINNFYTSTIYEKGAEIIRMYHTILGDAHFKKGLKLYFERHDGQAVTCQDFLKAMSDASGVNLDHFGVWYDQNGTPVISILTSYDEATQNYEIEITQNVVTNNTKYDCLYIPFHMELINSDGNSLDLGDNAQIILKDKVTKINCSKISQKPVPVFNTNFSAPVNIDYNYSFDELLTITAYAKDEYSRYNSLSLAFEWLIKDLTKSYKNGEALSIQEDFFRSLATILSDSSMDKNFMSYLIEPPKINYLLNKADNFDFEVTNHILNHLKYEIAKRFEKELVSIVDSYNTKEPYLLNTHSIGQRALVNISMWYLAHLDDKDINEKIYTIFTQANNMTIEFGALRALMVRNTKHAQKACKEFYIKWKKDTLVIQKWFRLNAVADFIDINYIKNLETLPEYDEKVPNLVRALVGAYSTNVVAVNNSSGVGYKYLCDKILEIDQFNPQIAARLAKSFSYINKIDNERKTLLTQSLKELLKASELSNDTMEIISTNLS